MKKMTHFSIIGVLFLLIFQPLNAQSQQGYYMHIDYVDIPKDNIPAFENHINSTLKSVQETRIHNKNILEWYIYRVAYPGTQTPNYNYVMVSISGDAEDFNDARIEISDRISEMSGNQMMNEFRNMLIPYRSELWRINNSVLTSDSTKASKYFIMDYMNVTGGMEYAYQMMEDEIALPIHEYRMEIEQMNGWELFSLIVPGGTEYGYNFATANYFSELRDFEFGFTEEIIRQSHPDTDINEINETFSRTRDLVRSEVWELIDYVK